MRFRFSLPTLAIAFSLASAARGEDGDAFSMADYDSVEKIDSHFHLQSQDTRFVELAKADRFRFINIAVHTTDPIAMKFRHETTHLQRQKNPDRVLAVCSFPLAGWDDPDWPENTLRYLDDQFAKGAVGVKVWKDIGMEFRRADGKLVMIDDPQFDPIFRHLQARGIRLIGHLGEPKNCWLPLEKMTVNNDRNYFRRNPKYHMYLHPEMPSYEDQIAARDRMLAKNPDLHFIGAHFGSLEWSVDELGKFLDRFPNASVDTAARMGQLQYQSIRDREKVRRFLDQYQDRILYGTDFSMSPDADPEVACARARSRWLADWRYFTTGEMMEVPELSEPVQGLSLSKAIVEKIYRTNAERLFPPPWPVTPKPEAASPPQENSSAEPNP